MAPQLGYLEGWRQIPIFLTLCKTSRQTFLEYHKTICELYGENLKLDVLLNEFNFKNKEIMKSSLFFKFFRI